MIRQNLTDSTWPELETNGKSVFPFRNDSERFQSAREWAVELAAKHNKDQIVKGLEPAGHYWFCLAIWMVSNYTTRPENPLKKMQSLIVITCKLLRVIYTILTSGTVYDLKKMLMDVRRPEKKEALAA